MAANINTVETRSKFGVPLTGAVGSGILQPKQKYRFRLSLLNFAGSAETKVLTQSVNSVGRPTITYDEVEIHSYNSRDYIQGKHSWNTIDIVLRDDITNSVSKLVGAQAQRQVNHFQQTTPAAANDFKFDAQIEILDGVNAGASEVWFLEGCFLTSVNYDDVDYSSNEVLTISLTVRYGNATHYQGDNDINGRVNAGNPFPEIADLNDPLSITV